MGMDPHISASCEAFQQVAGYSFQTIVDLSAYVYERVSVWVCFGMYS